MSRIAPHCHKHESPKSPATTLPEPPANRSCNFHATDIFAACPTHRFIASDDEHTLLP